MYNLVILIQCQDRVGLVTDITSVLAKHKLNIIAMREFVDEAENKFFTRIACSGVLDDENIVREELSHRLPPESKISLLRKADKNIVVLVTKEFHCLADLLVRNHFKTLGANVKCVIGNHEILREFSEKMGVPFFYVSTEEKSKEQFEEEILNLLSRFEVDYIVLAKFMRILSPNFLAHFESKIINIHHSFLPAFVGANPYKQAFQRGVKIIGATAHFVTSNLDEGPIISQQTIHVNHTFNSKQMAVAGREIEKAVLSKALEQVLEDRVFVTGNKTIVFE
ncbi:MAG: formyltetrahydrofolate deformylase [Pedobacter sp.]|nr:MAG: formyltetrahydrofolate deformylase [Pedobacter sp.]